MNRRSFITLLGGMAATWPLAARAQQPAMPVIGFLHSASSAPFVRLIAAFREGLSENGYVEGRNAAIEYRWAEGQYDRLPALAADLVAHQVAVLVALGPAASLVAKDATTTIPVVFSTGDDPVKVGLVTNLNRPGGNVTGVHIFTGELEPKRLGLLSQMVPKARLIAFLVNPGSPQLETLVKDAQTAASAIDRQILVVRQAAKAISRQRLRPLHSVGPVRSWSPTIYSSTACATSWWGLPRATGFPRSTNSASSSPPVA
jgi:putative ABC transport system substrate-binding protein